MRRHVRYPRLCPAAIGDVGVGIDQAATAHRRAAYLQHRAVLSYALEAIVASFPCQCQLGSDLVLRAAGGRFAALRLEPKDVLEVGGPRNEHLGGQIKKLPRPLIADDHAQVVVEITNAAWKVVDDCLQDGGALNKQPMTAFQLFAQSLTLGDVVVRCHPCTVQHWTIVDRENAAIAQLAHGI